MHQQLKTFSKALVRIYSGKNLLWQLVMLAATAALVLSGADWAYFVATRGTWLATIGFLAASVGFFIPVILPLAMLYGSVVKHSQKTRQSAYALIYAAILGLGISSFYKVFTGRTGLPHALGGGFGNFSTVVDTSHMFRFGFYRGGAFQGWPSSHTAVAFAMSFALVTMYPKNRLVQVLAIAYALFIGIGVSVSIHWLSDFIAGAILGTIIGVSVGKTFGEQ